MKVYPSNDSTYNFEVQSFKFSGNFDQVKIPEQQRKKAKKSSRDTLISFLLKDEI